MNSSWEFEFESLMKTVLDGTAGPAELARLERLLTATPEAQDAYLQLIALDTMLQARSGRLPAAAAPTASSAAANKPTAGKPAPKSPVLGFLNGIVDYVNHSKSLLFLLVFIALSGWFIFQVGSVLLGRWWAANAPVADQPGLQQPGQKPGNELAGGQAPAVAKRLAWVSGSVNARWQIVAANPRTGAPAEVNSAGGVFWPLGTEISGSQQVNLVAGLAEITFGSGTKAVLSAPARFTVMTALRTDLQMGKLSAQVPHTALGFTVSTPAGSVVDLGTEFGVEVTAEKTMEVQVFTGQVAVNSNASDGSQLAGPAVHVTAGHAVHVAPGKPVTIIAAKENRFHRDLELRQDSRDAAMAEYFDYVRELKPAVWLRMQGSETNRTIHDEMSGAADGELHWQGAGNPFVEGRLGKALWLRGPRLGDYAIIPNYPKAEHDKLTVAAWVYADSRPNFATIAKNGPPLNGNGQFHLMLAAPVADPNDPRRPNAVDLAAMFCQPDGKIIGLREGLTHPFPLHDWQHVAFVADGQVAHLYREGREVNSVKYEGLNRKLASQSLSIGGMTSEPSGLPDPSFPGFWSGQIDDILIFNDALTAEQIKKLAAAPAR